MKTSLKHLPDSKRRELSSVVQILLAEFHDATKNKQIATRKMGRILKVVLFGSYARGDWVEDRASGYRSDYDLLVVVSHDELTDVVEYWTKADERLLREYETTRTLSAPANFIVHSLSDVNRQLGLGRPFFVDILRDGVVLYQSEDQPFAKPRQLSPEEARKEAQQQFDRWFESAGGFLRNAGYAVKDSDNKLAAFLLHQATERLYHCLLLTLTLYSPKSHRLNFLRAQAERLGAGADRRLASDGQVRTAMFRVAAEGLHRRPLFAALQDHARGTGLAKRADCGSSGTCPQVV
ncbi:nucleotidyltransferase domain-containing protein [Phenylobacterium sp. J426]|uniref:nucleotidyltransferase domain-containing protein n=1 Tax=Phenylobacterium sp. J426 TaxID=2898439 RepID=UPI0027E316A2|nr:nucleotidyltransferase domain-containing protein [Phenylobacterium sp. J426]